MRYHRALCDAFTAALDTAHRDGDLASAAATAEVLALLAYGVNLRSRAGGRTPPSCCAPCPPLLLCCSHAPVDDGWLFTSARWPGPRRQPP